MNNNDLQSLIANATSIHEGQYVIGTANDGTTQFSQVQESDIDGNLTLVHVDQSDVKLDFSENIDLLQILINNANSENLDLTSLIIKWLRLYPQTRETVQSFHNQLISANKQIADLNKQLKDAQNDNAELEQEINELKKVKPDDQQHSKDNSGSNSVAQAESSESKTDEPESHQDKPQISSGLS